MWGGLLIMIIAMIMARIIMVTIGRIGDKGESILCLCADGKIREGSGRAPKHQKSIQIDESDDLHYSHSQLSLSLSAIIIIIIITEEPVSNSVFVAKHRI